MPDLSDAEREELARIREAFGEPELGDRPAIVGTADPVDPMLAETLAAPLESIDESAWQAEPKYDGTRLLVQTGADGDVRAYTRRGIDRYGDIEAVHGDLQAQPAEVILDGEYTFVTADGVSTFRPIHTDRASLSREELEPVYYVFDLLYDGEDLTGKPLAERRDRLADRLVPGQRITPAPAEASEFPAYYDELTDAGEEGLVLKRRQSRYYPGVRSRQWLKVKRFTERDAVVVGYTPGEGSRADTFGSLVLTDGERCIGRVGSGFSEAELAAIAADVTETDERRVSVEAAGAAYTPVEPFVCTVKYQEITHDGKLRAPVFLALNPEKPVADVEPID